MKTLIDHLSQYAEYHRDPRNIHTHFVGVPMIMFAVVILLSRPTWMVGAVPLSPALLAALAASVFYFRLDMRFGLAMAALLAAMLVGGQWVAAQTLAVWLATGIGLIAAIPAVVAYNKLNADSDHILGGYDAFADEFATILSRQLDA